MCLWAPRKSLFRDFPNSISALVARPPFAHHPPAPAERGGGIADRGEHDRDDQQPDHRRRPSLRDQPVQPARLGHLMRRSEEHTSELQSLMRISYAVFCLKKK